MKRFALACFCVTCCRCAGRLAQSRSSLADLIQAGNRKAALDRIRTGADVNEAQPDGTRPIHWAVYKVDYELIDALIAKKAKVDVTNEFGSTPLAEAVKLADARMVKMLLDAGAGVEGANQDGQTALMLAIKTGELPIVEMLVKAGANVNTVEKFQQPNAFDVGCHRAEKCGRDDEAAAFQRRRRQASRAVYGLAEPAFLGASRSVPSRRGIDRPAVCRTQRLL